MKTLDPVVIYREHLSPIIITGHQDDDYACVTWRCEDEPPGHRSRSMRPSEALATARALTDAAYHLDPSLRPVDRAADDPAILRTNALRDALAKLQERVADIESWRESLTPPASEPSPSEPELPEGSRE